MRILQVIPFFYPSTEFGGSVSVAYNISKTLAGKGHEVVVYTTDAAYPRWRIKTTKIAYKIDGFKVYYFRSMPLSELLISPLMISYLNREISTFDMIHLHTYRSFQTDIGWFTAKQHNKPFVLSAHGTLYTYEKIEKLSRRKRILYRLHDIFGGRLVLEASAVIAVSREEIKHYLRFGVNEDKIKLLPNGVDTSYFTPGDGTSFRNKYRIDDKVKIILFVGRLHPVKGLNYLIKAFKHVKERVDDSKLVLIGNDFGMKNQLMNLCKTLRLSNEVLFINQLYGDRLVNAYRSSNVVVLPSSFEIFGLSILEACSCGKPVVASDVGGLRDIVANGYNGYLVRYSDESALAKAIISVLDDEKQKELGEAGRKLALNFDWKKIVESLEKVFAEITKF